MVLSIQKYRGTEVLPSESGVFCVLRFCKRMIQRELIA
jgi:hypothetical protein